MKKKRDSRILETEETWKLKKLRSSGRLGIGKIQETQETQKFENSKNLSI